MQHLQLLGQNKRISWRKRLATIFTGMVMLGAGTQIPINTVQSEWINSYATIGFNTADGDLDLNEYAVAGKGMYYIRTVPKGEGQIELVQDTASTTSPIAGKTEVKIACTGCKYFSEFKGQSGNIIRKEMQPSEYDSLKTLNAQKPVNFETITVFGAYIRPKIAKAAIAFDAFTDRQGATAATSLTYSHTTSGTNRYLIVNVRIDTSGSDVVTGVTYNTVAMTRIQFIATDGGTAGIYQYYLINPTTGANNVVVSTSGSQNIFAYTTSYTGVQQSSQPDASKTATASASATLTTTLTTVADNTWITSFMRFDTNTINSGTNFTVRGAGDSFRAGDSNAAITPAGATTVTGNSAGGSGGWWGIFSSLSPAAAATAKPITRPLIIY